MLVTEFYKTCDAFPSQWEGKTEDGRMFYCRYRWGNLTIDISESPTDDVFDAMDVNLLQEKYGMSSCLDESVMVEKMKSVGFIFSGV